MKILTLFIHPQVVSNLFTFLYSAKHKIRYFDNVGNMEVNCFVTNIIKISYLIAFFLSPYYRIQWLFFLLFLFYLNSSKSFFFNRRKKMMAYFFIFKYILYF